MRSDTSAGSGIAQADIDALTIIKYPDLRLQKASAPLAGLDENVRRLVDKMFELMFQAPGVGLAAAQVGINARLFVASPTCEQTDRRVYVNPEIVSAEGVQEEEEGCLSMPGVTSRIKRPATVTLRAIGLDGQTFQETGEGLLARVFQHEMDHLDGRLIVERMNSVARLANRRAIKDLEDPPASHA